jgi:hypothetical protein
MLRAKTFLSGMVLASSLLILAGLKTSADDRSDKEGAVLSGVWTLKQGETKIEYSDKKVVKIFPHGDNLQIAVICQYTADKAGLVKVKITGFEGDDETKKRVKQVLPPGTSFRFRWKVKDDSAKLDDVQGDQADHLKSHLEGEYGRK